MGEWLKAGVSPAMRAAFPNARSWVASTGDGVLLVVRTVEPNHDQSKWLTHLSISHSGTDAKPDRYPTWDEQKEACWRFAPGKRLVSYMPAEGEPYVNYHETTFHWWETTDEDDPYVNYHETTFHWWETTDEEWR